MTDETVVCSMKIVVTIRFIKIARNENCKAKIVCCKNE